MSDIASPPLVWYNYPNNYPCSNTMSWVAGVALAPHTLLGTMEQSCLAWHLQLWAGEQVSKELSWPQGWQLNLTAEDVPGIAPPA